MIFAVDFDGILCENDFPNIGEPNYRIISLVRQLMDRGHEVILWTSRVEEELDSAIKWCEDRGLHFSVVNESSKDNLREFEGVYTTEPRKIYADVYIDDKNIPFATVNDIRKIIERSINNGTW